MAKSSPDSGGGSGSSDKSSNSSSNSSTPPTRKKSNESTTLTLKTVDDHPDYAHGGLDSEPLCPPSVQDKGYSIGEKIGDGAFSTVYIATKKADATRGEKQMTLAVKLIRFDKVPETWKESRLKEELKITKKLDHRHIVKVYEVIKTKRRAFIFMELARGSIEDQLKINSNGLAERIARVWFLQLVEAIQFLHSKGVAHRDLKTENILLDEQNRVKVTDFGFACFVFDRTTRQEKMAKTDCGTKAYQAPETYSGEYDARISDIWSIGVILFEMLTNQLPFKDRFMLPDGITVQDVEEKVFFKWMIQKKYRFPNESTVSKNARNLIAKILEPNPTTRIREDAIAGQPWCTMK